MKSSPTSDDRPTPPDSLGMTLATTIADTTWRMFVPTVGLAIVGVVIDRSYLLAPWATIIGSVVGGAVAVLLVRRQLQRLNSNK